MSNITFSKILDVELEVPESRGLLDVTIEYKYHNPIKMEGCPNEEGYVEFYVYHQDEIIADDRHIYDTEIIDEANYNYIIYKIEND